MTASESKSEARSLLDELDELVDRDIESMSPAQLRRFHRDRKRIMESVTRRTDASRPSR